MIREISNFVESIEENDKDYFTSNLNPSPGLHVMLQLNEDDEIIEDSYKSYIFKKDGITVTFNDDGTEKPIECAIDFAKLEYYSSLISIDKPIDSNKKIHSSVPYIIWFKKEKFSKAKERIEEFYKSADKYVQKSDKEIVNKIRDFTLEKLFGKICEDFNYAHIKDTEYVKVYFNVSFEKIKMVQDNYLQKKIFVKDDFNISTENQEVLGLSGFINGANVKKKFMQHQTSNYLVNNRITKSQAINLFKFEKLLKSKPRKLPNPLPIFIEKEELNNDIIRLFGREGVKNYHDIIKQMFENHYNDLSNYYLINWKIIGKDIVIYDIDFVSTFKYKIEDLVLKNLMQLPDISDMQIKNIFQFELKVVNKIFDSKFMDYFGELDAKYFSNRMTTYQNLLTNRKNFYDFIYKSKREAVSGLIFYQIVVAEILAEIKRNDDFNKDWRIKEKLNILFSINEFFDKTNKNFGGINMASQIPEFQNMMRKLFADENNHIQSDNDFAFASGQLIYCILKESKSSNKSHALLEPFISKNDPKLFNEVIIRSISQYKHAFEWYGEYGKGRFEKLASEILGYSCETNIIKLLPIILAGYFSQSMIFESKKNNIGA